jgi:CheY-like chemotaxis protein
MATTILVCDNEEPLRRLIRATLGGGYRLIEARDGNESIELARSARPDLILLDMMMPDRSGLEVLRELRSDQRFAETPVIMLTARAQAADREAAGAIGADYFLAKPFSPAKLAALLEQLLAERR